MLVQTNALAEVTTYDYDDNSRLVKIIDALEHVTKLGYDDSGRLVSVTNPLGHTQTLEYDAADNLLKRFDALENSSHFEYNELNRLVESVDPLDRITKFDYDDLNRSVSSVDALQGESKQGFDADGNQASLTDPNSNTTQFEFDLNGNLVQETLATADKVKYTYDARDLLKTVTNGRQQQRAFVYDVLDRLESWTDPDGSVAYTYDNNGNVLTVVDPSGTISREFDALNRVTKYIDARGNVLQYAYDKVGDLVGLTYPDNKLVAYEYDAAGQLIKVTDWADRVTVYTYDENGRLISTLRPNGTLLTRSYDDAGQLLRQDDVVSFEFNYDAAGNIVAERTNPEADPEINLEMTYQAANRLATVADEVVEFDADGNMVLGVVNQFDSRNRLVQAGDVVYSYDAENQRIGVNQTQFVVNSQPALSQVLVKEENGQKTFYIYGLGLIGQEVDGEYTSYHFDYRGSTVALTDSSGQVTENFQYSPYGLLLSGDSSKTPFLFNSMYGVMADSNGLYYMRARFYSPEIRRFINQDILLGSISEGQTLNRYAFVTGRPVSFIDPFGFKGKEPIGIDFNKSFWGKSGIRTITNCYGYALNKPGSYGNPGDRSYHLFHPLTCSNVMDGAKKDGGVDPSGEGTCGGECPVGFHKIQIFLDPGWLDPDYHVYRQDRDGSWSHKAGRRGYIRQEILCPINLDRDNTPYGGRNYPDYCGTLCIKSEDIGAYWWNKL